MEQNKSKIITIGYLVLMVIFIIMLNIGGGDHSGGSHGDNKHHAKPADGGDPTAYKEAVEPDSETAKLAYLNQALEKIASTDNRPKAKSDEEGKNPFASKVSPDVAIAKLQQGNIRFAKGESTHPNLDAERRLLAATESQADHAFATVLACSDSRVPVEAIFDAGVMDIFTVRAAGNVCNADQIKSIEYGIYNVHTPVAVILGHTQCDHIKPDAIEANVWTAMEELFMKSPVTRDFVSKGYAMVVGAVYDIGTGNVNWLSEDTTFEILAKVEASKDKVIIEEDSAKDDETTSTETTKEAEGQKETQEEQKTTEEPKSDKV